MIVAVMAQIVTMFRRRPGTATGAAAESDMVRQSSLAADAGEKPSNAASERRWLVSIVV
jgi:hypothetical protein